MKQKSNEEIKNNENIKMKENIRLIGFKHYVAYFFG